MVEASTANARSIVPPNPLVPVQERAGIVRNGSGIAPTASAPSEDNEAPPISKRDHSFQDGVPGINEVTWRDPDLGMGRSKERMRATCIK
jgi:hypothetical protein